MRTLTTLLICMSSYLLLSQEQIGDDLLGTEAFEQMGYSVALSEDGRILVISGPFKGNSQGSVLIYADIFNSWMFQWGVNGIEQGVSGFSNAISDDGKIMVTSSPTTPLGQFNVFEKGGIDYQALGVPVEGPSDGNTLFGYKMAISGDGKRIAAGAIAFDGSEENVGFVQTYEFNEGEWQTLGTPLSGEVPFGEMGRALDLSFDGSIMAVGIPTNLDNLGPSEVQVYQFNGDDWELMGNPISGDEDLTGFSVALSGNGKRVAVGSPLGSGRVNVYEFDGQDWKRFGSEMTIASSRLSGYSVDMSNDGNRVLIGAPGTNITSTQGAVAVYDYDGADWQPVFDEVKGLVGEAFAWSISLAADGQTFAIGIPGSDFGDTDQGRVEVFRIDPVQTNILTFTDQDITTYPNPATDFMSILGSDVNYQRSARIVDVTGKLLHIRYIRNQELNVADLVPGQYHLLVPYGEKHHIPIPFIKL